MNLSPKVKIMIQKNLKDFSQRAPEMKEFRGISKGMDTAIIREKDRI